MASKEGLDYATSLIHRYKHLPMFFWSSIPCTGGSTAQRRNKHRPGHDARMAKHNRLFVRLHRNLMILAEMVLKETADGHFVFEWPFPNDWWQRKEMKKMVKHFGLKFADFHGCRVGSTASSGLLTKKPWRLATTSDEMVEEFRDLLCTADWRRSLPSKERWMHENHELLEGGNRTAESAFYPILASH